MDQYIPKTCPAATRGTPANATGANSLSCNLASGNWASSGSACLAPSVQPPKVVCVAIKPTQTGTLYSCTRPDGTTYYTEEPPTNEPEPIFPLMDGSDASIGMRMTPCQIDTGSKGYQMGGGYLCAAVGWKQDVKKGNQAYWVVCE